MSCRDFLFGVALFVPRPCLFSMSFVLFSYGLICFSSDGLPLLLAFDTSFMAFMALLPFCVSCIFVVFFAFLLASSCSLLPSCCSCMSCFLAKYVSLAMLFVLLSVTVALSHSLPLSLSLSFSINLSVCFSLSLLSLTLPICLFHSRLRCFPIRLDKRFKHDSEP